MGKIIKLGFLLISVLILIFIAVGVINGVSNIRKGTNISKQNASTLPGKNEYEKIRVGDTKTGNGGMNLKEVEQILGKPTSQSQGTSGNLVMDVYTFATNAGPNSILISFINGHVSGKTQTGLK